MTKYAKRTDEPPRIIIPTRVGMRGHSNKSSKPLYCFAKSSKILRRRQVLTTQLPMQNRALEQVPRTHIEDPRVVRRRVKEQQETQVELPLNKLVRAETRRTVQTQTAEMQQERSQRVSAIGCLVRRSNCMTKPAISCSQTSWTWS